VFGPRACGAKEPQCLGKLDADIDHLGRPAGLVHKSANLLHALPAGLCCFDLGKLFDSAFPRFLGQEISELLLNLVEQRMRRPPHLAALAAGKLQRFAPGNTSIAQRLLRGEWALVDRPHQPVLDGTQIKVPAGQAKVGHVPFGQRVHTPVSVDAKANAFAPGLILYDHNQVNHRIPHPHPSIPSSDCEIARNPSRVFSPS
jgi:hypothetical protein